MQPQCKVVFFICNDMKRIITTFILTSFATSLWAQGSADACRFSQTYYQGTAKALGMGNALGAVGGDMTAICINPAGMGLYRSSELSMTLNLSDNYHTSSYYGTERDANKFRVSIPSLGYVHSREKSNYKPLRYSQFCIGLTRTNDYNMHTYASGLNPTSSKIDDYLMQIDGYSPDDLANNFAYTAYPAWNTYLIDLDGQGYYTSPVPQGGITQKSEQDFKGRSEEWMLGYSANFNDRLYIGACLNILHIKRFGTSVHQESMPNDSNIETDFNQWTFTEELSSRGIGVNGKIGLIWRANPWLRLGAAFHSPSFYSFDESWQTTTESQINWVTRKSYSPESNYNYKFFSPLKCVGSMAFVIGQRGMVSFDAEYVNYGMARFFANDFNYDVTNQEIKDSYTHTFNFRLGTEWQINDSYLRFGAGYYGSPFGLGQQNGSIKKASVGISLPLGTSTTFDLAYELSHGKQQYTLYNAGSLGIEPVTQSQFRSVAIATLKVHF